jgi:hypothetical protein
MAWDNPEDYSYLKNASAEQFAWEFIRRDPAYRVEWDETYALLEKQKFFEKNNVVKLSLTDPQFGLPPFGCNPPRQNPWGLQVYPHPDVCKPAILKTKSLFLPRITQRGKIVNIVLDLFPSFVEPAKGALRIDDTHQFVMIFDVRVPLVNQLEGAKKEFLQQIKIAKGKSADANIRKNKKDQTLTVEKIKKYIFYLRLLDLEKVRKVQSIRYNVIVTKLDYPNEDPRGHSHTHHAFLAHAKNMMNNGWKKLIDYSPDKYSS